MRTVIIARWHSRSEIWFMVSCNHTESHLLGHIIPSIPNIFVAFSNHRENSASRLSSLVADRFQNPSRVARFILFSSICASSSSIRRWSLLCPPSSHYRHLLVWTFKALKVVMIYLSFPQPDDLLSSKIQSLCPTITGNVCCTEAQFETLRTQVQQVKFSLCLSLSFFLF